MSLSANWNMVMILWAVMPEESYLAENGNALRLRVRC